MLLCAIVRVVRLLIVCVCLCLWLLLMFVCKRQSTNVVLMLYVVHLFNNIFEMFCECIIETK